MVFSPVTSTYSSWSAEPGNTSLGLREALLSCAFLILLIDNLNDNENIFYVNEWGTMGIGKEAKQNAILEEKDKKQSAS